MEKTRQKEVTLGTNMRSCSVALRNKCSIFFSGDTVLPLVFLILTKVRYDHQFEYAKENISFRPGEKTGRYQIEICGLGFQRRSIK